MKKLVQGKKSFIAFFSQINRRAEKIRDQKSKIKLNPIVLQQLDFDNVAYLSDN